MTPRNPIPHIDSLEPRQLLAGFNFHVEPGTPGAALTEFKDSFLNYDTKVLKDGKILRVGKLTSRGLVIIRQLPDGRLDPEFGKGGLIVKSHPDDWSFSDAKFVAGGKILAWGDMNEPTSVHQNDWLLVRLNGRGTFDASFGDGGVVRHSFGVGKNEFLRSVEVTADGRIIGKGNLTLSNHTRPAEAIAAFLPDGTLDTTFSGDGMMTLQLSENENPYTYLNLHALPDGRFILEGSYRGPGELSEYIPVVARLKANGRFDKTFGGDGFADLPQLWGERGQYSVHVVDGGKVILAGQQIDEDDLNYRNCPLIFARLTEAGGIDPAFGKEGVVRDTTAPSRAHFRGFSPLVVNEITSLDDGKLVFVTNGSDELQIGRLHPKTGGIDRSFGNEGLTALNIDDRDEIPFHILVRPDGDLLVAGYSEDYDFVSGRSAPGWFARFNANGSIDRKFGGVHYDEHRTEPGGTTTGSNNLLIGTDDGDEILLAFDKTNGLYRVTINGQQIVEKQLNSPFGEVERVVIDARRGDDRVTVTGNAGVQVQLLGGPGNDTLVGASGPETLTGGAGNDSLVANAGNDRLVGGPGADYLSDGVGNDTLLTDPTDSLLDGEGDDTLLD